MRVKQYDITEADLTVKVKKKMKPQPLTPCNARFHIDKEKGIFDLECDGAKDHCPCKINLAVITHAFTYLKEHGLLPKTKPDVSFMANQLLTVLLWKLDAEKETPFLTKQNLRECFPGIGGDMLNSCLKELVTEHLVKEVDDKKGSLYYVPRV